MKDGKYIIVEVRGHQVPILFHPLIEHNIFKGWNITAAGFFEVHSDQENHDHHYVRTWGESTSLDIKSHPEDEVMIEKFLNN